MNLHADALFDFREKVGKAEKLEFWILDSWLLGNPENRNSLELKLIQLFGSF